MVKKKSEIKAHLPKMVSIALLSQHPLNANSQSSAVFGELVESIEDSGFDESIIAVPRDDGVEGYFVIAGNHRYEAAKQLGMHEIPTVVRSDWTPTTAKTELIRRNNIKGTLDVDRFTTLVNSLKSELPFDEMYEAMAFSQDDFAKHYKADTKSQDSEMDKILDSKPVSVVDHVNSILAELFDRHGSTVPNSFIIFPVGGKRHMFVNSNVALKVALDTIVVKCIQQNVDINVALGGLLKLGMDASDFEKTGISGDVKKLGAITGDSDEIEFVKVGE